MCAFGQRSREAHKTKILLYKETSHFNNFGEMVDQPFATLGALLLFPAREGRLNSAEVQIGAKVNLDRCMSALGCVALNSQNSLTGLASVVKGLGVVVFLNFGNG